MGFRNGSYATVWEVKEASNTRTDLRISIEYKDKQSGEYVQDFSGYVSCFGTAAAAKAKLLQKKSRIKIGDCDVGARYDKEKRITYYNFKIFSFDDVTDGGPRHSEPDGDPEPKAEAEEPKSPNLPF